MSPLLSGLGVGKHSPLLLKETTILPSIYFSLIHRIDTNSKISMGRARYKGRHVWGEVLAAFCDEVLGDYVPRAGMEAVSKSQSK